MRVRRSCPDIYFATSGTDTIQFQTREDGFDIGQVVLSAKAFLRDGAGRQHERSNDRHGPLCATATRERR